VEKIIALPKCVKWQGKPKSIMVQTYGMLISISNRLVGHISSNSSPCERF